MLLNSTRIHSVIINGDLVIWLWMWKYLYLFKINDKFIVNK